MLSQQIAVPTVASAAEVVARMGAVQAQDYRNALWAIGLRTAGATEASVERAIAKREIVRTWPMRGTLHFVAAADVHWMLELLTPRVLAAARKRAEQHGLDAATLSRCRELAVTLLSGEQQLARESLFAAFQKEGIATDAQRGYHILWRLAQERLICGGPREGKQPTFVLLDEWVPPSQRSKPADPLAELAARYFASHGPATLQDFVWWCGLKVSDARAAIASAELARETIDGVEYWLSGGQPPLQKTVTQTHLLPAFDEYLLGYRDRSRVLDAADAGKVVPGGNGVFLPTVVVNGQVIGTWKRSAKSDKVLVAISPFHARTPIPARALQSAAAAYGRFVGSGVELISA
jgi:hypothetical protein